MMTARIRKLRRLKIPEPFILEPEPKPDPPRYVAAALELLGYPIDTVMTPAMIGQLTEDICQSRHFLNALEKHLEEYDL
jgi:hypothetical protein